MKTHRKFLQNKLWRDKAAQLLEAHGSYVERKHLNDEEFAAELKLKLQEESAEILSATSPQELIEECADVIEVMAAFGSLYGFTLEDILAARARKRDARGGFDARSFITYAYHKPGSFGEAYCLKDPTKYPEVAD